MPDAYSSSTQQRRVLLRKLPTTLLESVGGSISGAVCAAWRHTPQYANPSIIDNLINSLLTGGIDLGNPRRFSRRYYRIRNRTPRNDPLWNMLLRWDLLDDLFEDMDFCIFGLGDLAYERFCWSAKKLSRRLLGLGAREICSRGEGDDQHQLGYVIICLSSPRY